MLSSLMDALALGAIYALIAVGYTLVYGIIKLISFAHGEFFMGGAFAGYFVLRSVHTGHPVADFVLAIIAGALVLAIALGAETLFHVDDEITPEALSTARGEGVRRVYTKHTAPALHKQILVLLVEQNAKQALAIADRAYVLESGKVSASGPASEIARDERIVEYYLGNQTA